VSVPMGPGPERRRERFASLASIARLEELLGRLGWTPEAVAALFDEHTSDTRESYLRADWIAREIQLAERYLDGV
jgi:hypothetical protein